MTTKIETGDKIIVSPEWLATCGLSRFEGKAFTVSAVADYGPTHGIMYDVMIADGQREDDFDYGFNWVVWSHRGVTKVEG